MKRISIAILIVFLVGLLCAPAIAQDRKKITELTEDTAPTNDDLAVTVNSPGGSPATRKVTLSNFMKTWNLGTFAAPTTDNPYTLTAANASNFVLWYGATGTINLPAAVAGMTGCIYNTGAFTITIDPNGTDVVVRDGTAQGAGVSFTLSSGAGNFVCIIADTANHWVTLGYKGTLAEGT